MAAAHSSSLIPALIASPLDDILVASLLNPRRKKRVDWVARYREARPGHMIYWSPSRESYIVQRFNEQGRAELVREFREPKELEEWIQKELDAGNPKRPSASKRSLLLWSARNFGYEKASAEPTLADMQVIVEAEYVHRVPATLLREMLSSAQAAYYSRAEFQNPSTMGEAIALSSPSGRMSKRALKAAQERLRVQLFGKHGLAYPSLPQPDEKTNLLRRAQELRGLAERGMHPRKYTREAEKLERRAAAINPRPVLTRELAWAASMDAGNRSMRKAGRKTWNEDDYNAAVDEFNRLWPEGREGEAAWAASHPNPCSYRVTRRFKIQ